MTCVRHPPVGTAQVCVGLWGRIDYTNVPEARQRNTPEKPRAVRGVGSQTMLPRTGFRTRGFSAREQKHCPFIRGGFANRAGVVRRRAGSNTQLTMTDTSDDTTICSTGHQGQMHHSLTPYVQSRPITSNTHWTCRSPRYVLRRGNSRGSSGTSNTSNQITLLSEAREVPSSFLSQFRGYPNYIGRIGRRQITPQKPPFHRLYLRFPTSNGFEGALDVIGRSRGWSYV